MGSVSDGVSMRGAGAGSRGWRAGPVGDARAALRRSKARRAVSRAPRRWKKSGRENERPGALDNNRGMWLHPSRGVSADRGRPAACDRARPADSSAGRHGHGARESNRRRARRSRPVGGRLGSKNNSDAASRTIATWRSARLGFRGPGSSRGGGETRNRRPESASTYLDVLHVPGGRASRSDSRASRAGSLSHLANEAKTSGGPNFFPD